MNIQIERMDYFISFWFRILTFFFLVYIVQRSLKSYQSRPTKSKKMLFLSFTSSMFGMGFAVIIALINAFFQERPVYLFRLIVSCFYITQLLAVTLSIHFTVRAFYETYKKTTLAIFDIITGLFIGMIVMTIPSASQWNPDGHPPELLTDLIILGILFMSIKVYQYAKRSAKKQTKMLLRKSMEIYSLGVLIFLIGMGFITLVSLAINGLNLPSTHPVSIILNNMIYIFNPINTYLMYVGCFQPEWFRNRYEDSWIGNKLTRMGFIKD
jgi:hypothetical protein